MAKFNNNLLIKEREGMWLNVRGQSTHLRYHGTRRAME